MDTTERKQARLLLLGRGMEETASSGKQQDQRQCPPAANEQSSHTHTDTHTRGRPTWSRMASKLLLAAAAARAAADDQGSPGAPTSLLSSTSASVPASSRISAATDSGETRSRLRMAAIPLAFMTPEREWLVGEGGGGRGAGRMFACGLEVPKGRNVFCISCHHSIVFLAGIFMPPKP